MEKVHPGGVNNVSYWSEILPIGLNGELGKFETPIVK